MSSLKGKQVWGQESGGSGLTASLKRFLIPTTPCSLNLQMVSRCVDRILYMAGTGRNEPYSCHFWATFLSSHSCNSVIESPRRRRNGKCSFFPHITYHATNNVYDCDHYVS